MSKLSRRSFLKRSLGFADKRQAVPDIALVCVFLRGGADTLNILVPYGDDDYYRARQTIAIARPGTKYSEGGSALKLDDFYGLHPACAPLLAAYRNGHLAFVQAVGSDNTSGSHFSAQDQMEHGEAFKQTLGGGWLGRYLGSFADKNCGPLAAVAIGTTLPESLRAAPSASVVNTVEEVALNLPPDEKFAIMSALYRLYGLDTNSELLSVSGRSTLDLLLKVEKMRGGKGMLDSAHYPQTQFAGGLREVARLIKAQVGLRVACLDLGGWDTHFVQGGAQGLQARAIGELFQGLAAFEQDLLAYRRSYVVLVLTEFGRRVYENASLGTDHGRGFAFMALGSKIKGGKVYGQWPGLQELESENLLGPSGMRVLIDYRSVLSELLGNLCGVKDRGGVFPGLKESAPLDWVAAI